MSNIWISHFKNISHSPKKVKMFCFPYAGGGASSFYEWNRLFPKDIEICPMQLPGRENRIMEPLYNNLSELLSELIKNIKEEISILPYIFFGHSMGALVAYELCHRLQKMSLPLPLHLYLSGQNAPSYLNKDNKHSMLEDSELIKVIRENGGFPSNNEEILKICLPIIRADFNMIDHYSFTLERLNNCNVTVLGGENDKLTSYEGLNSWSNYFNNKINLKTFQGDHFFIFQKQIELVQLINEDYNKFSL